MTLWYRYPHTSMHDMDLDWILNMIKELKEKVDQMDMETILSRLDDIDTALGSLETDNVRIKADLLTAQGLISQLRTDLTADEARIDTIESTLENIDVILQPLSERVDELSANVGAMQSQVTSNTGRIEALEEATLNAPTEANENLLSIAQFQNLDNLDYEIVVVTDNGASTNNIEVYDGLIRMRPEATHNECALVIKNVLPVLAGTYTSSMILSFGLKYKTSGSNNGTDYCVNVPFTSLTGSSPYIANTGYTSTRASLRVLQLKIGSDGKSYDLWIYNKYQGQYPILPGANISILALAMVFRGFDSSFTTASIKAYFSTIYGNTAPQVSALIDKKSSGIVSSAVFQARIYTDAVADNLGSEINTKFSSAEEWAEQLDQEYVDQSSCAFNDEPYCSFNEIQGLSQDVTVDYSDCRYGQSKWHGIVSQLSHWQEELRIWINIELTISGSSVVNTANSVAVLNVSNTLGATINKMIPLTAHCALPSKAPFVEAYLHTNGNIIFRLWFDDTNWDYTNNPITVRIAGFIPLTYQAEE